MLLPRHTLRRPFAALSSTRNFSSSQTALADDSVPTPTRSPPTHYDLLPLCSAVKSLRHAQQIHAFSVSKAFLPRSVSLCASLILRYAEFGAHSASRRLFEDSVEFCETAFLWNTLVRACYVSGVRDGFGVYNRMVRTGLVFPDGHTFPFLLKLCTDFGETRKGLEIHGCVFKLGFDGDVFVGNTLMAFYGGCGNLPGARKVFDEMPERDIVSWNTFIGTFSLYGFHEEAIKSYREMGSSSSRPNSVSLVSVLPACSGLGDEATASEIHCHAVKLGLDRHVTVVNALVDVYGKCGDVESSKRVFDEMGFRNEVSWNSAITSLAFTGRNGDALFAFRSMVESGFGPNPIAVSSVLPVLVELGLFNTAKEIHCVSIRSGLDSDVFVSNSLIDMYSKSGRPMTASVVFENSAEKNIVSWNAMVSNFVQNGLESVSLELLRRMQSRGETPNEVTFANALPGCARLGLVGPGKEIHARAIRAGPASDLFVSNALIDMYAKCGRFALARRVFEVSRRDRVSYNTLIAGYSQSSDCSESLALFSEMGLAGISHDAVSYAGAAAACANLGAIGRGKELHGALTRRHAGGAHLFVSNSLVDLYAKCGRPELARRVFDRIPSRDAASWNAMIMGYAMIGEAEAAIGIFEAMDDRDRDPVSYLAVLSACSHRGLVEKGTEYFSRMRASNLEPRPTHYACLVDLIGRAGFMEEVLELVRGMSFEPDANMWGALLGACRVHGDVVIGKWAAEKLFRLKPWHSGYYVLLSNMYAEAGRWNEANRVRELMKSMGVKKGPAFSWVQIGNRVLAFGAGDP